MQIDELTKFTKLFDTYGKLLSDKQYEVFNHYLNLDLSESELAELENGSRQSIHDAVTKAKNMLISFEERCHIVESHEYCIMKLQELKKMVSGHSDNDFETTIDDIIQKLQGEN